MTLAVWTDAQVLAQLESGMYWSTTTITYAFPTTTTYMTGTQEKTGFSAFTATQKTAAILALSLWDDLIKPSIVAGTGATNISFGNSTAGVSFAQTYFPKAGTAWFNPTYSELLNPTNANHGLITYVHELGHALGLEHMGNYNGSGTWTPSSYQDSTVYSVMSYFGPDWGSGAANGQGLVAWADWVGSDGILYAPQTPMLNDIMAVQAIYGADPTTRVGDTTYGFHSTLGAASGGLYDFTLNAHPILCIYDAGGVDTLDLSGWSTSSTISLVPGTFSSCNSMTNNISISYTTVIENAVGGAGNDTMTGNAYNNVLDGGAGNDILIGGMGNDILIGGTGTDVAVYAGALSLYSILYNALSGHFTISGGSDGADDVSGVEIFRFNAVDYAATSFMTHTGPAPIVPTDVSIAAVTTSANEGNSGTTPFTFVVSLATAAAAAQSLTYTVAGTGANAASTNDFAGALSGTITFAAGEITKTVTVLVAGDTVVEQNETFTVTLANPTSGLHIVTASATATIINDDVAPLHVINGNAFANVLTGTAGNDQINGFGGNDIINAGQGNDVINGGTGNDSLFGGAGNDTFQFTDLHFGRDTIFDYSKGADHLQFAPTIAHSMADFVITGQGTHDVFLNHGIDQVHVHSVTAITLAASDFIFG